MVLMALDHTRDFFHAGAMTFSPEDLTRTTPILFLTRWITHVCAPVFLFTAGIGAFLRLQRPGSTKAQLSRFLWTRGLWLVFLELTVMRAGDQLLVRRALSRAAARAVGARRLDDRARGAHPPAAPRARRAEHRRHRSCTTPRRCSGVAVRRARRALECAPPARRLLRGGCAVVAGYPVVPWVAVMAAGFCAGPVFLLEPQVRRQFLLRWGTVSSWASCCCARSTSTAIRSRGPRSHRLLFTVISFLRTTKYPPSLAFLLMTLGPALLALVYFDRRGLRAGHPLVVLGRVPLFYYVLHFWLLHVLASAFAWVRYGTASFTFLFSPLPSMGGAAALFPAGFGYPLWVTYAVWIAVVVCFIRCAAGLRDSRRGDGTGG